MLPKADQPWTLLEAAHLLNRAGFGGNPAEISALHALGREKAVDSLLNATDAPNAYPIPSWATLENTIAEYRQEAAARQEFKKDLGGLTPEQVAEKKSETIKKFAKIAKAHALEGQGWWFRRMLTTAAPLREKMTLFWHDHFATSVQKVKQPSLMITQNELFRKQALGSFRDLTQAVLMDPAMIEYLDTESSKKDHPNENFAREVMELFTLGEGNYTEQDIHEAARAFTGYQFKRVMMTVTHNKRQWDETPKTVFGNTGPFDGKDVINLIFDKEQPARFMSKKLWEFFVAENPPKAAIDALADTYRKAGYQAAPLLREIFLSREFYSESVMRTQIKSPIQYLISMMKQLEISEPPFGFPIAAQQQLGQILFMPPNVAGWDWGQAWINTNTLLTRYNLAGFLTQGSAGNGDKMMSEEKVKMPGMASAPKQMGRGWDGPDYEKIAPRPLRENPTQLVDALTFRFFQGVLPEKAHTSFIEYATSKKGVIFTNKEISELCHLMLSTPYYQLS